MESAVSSCRLCGGLLKPRARQCSTCGADLSLITGQTTASTSSAAAQSSAGAAPPSAPSPPDTAPPEEPAPLNPPPAASTSGAAVAAPPVEQSPCDTALSEKLVPLNKKQKIFATIGGIFLVCMFVTALAGLFAFAFVSLIVGGICAAISAENKSKKKALISEHVVQAMLADNFEQAQYSPSETFSYEHLRTSQLRRWTGRSSNDLLKAEYKGVTFAFSDVSLWRGSGRSQTYVFGGQWLTIGLHRGLPTPLMVSELEKKGNFDKRVERQQLGGRFNVLCEDAEVAAQVLTPEFMEFLLAASDSQHLFFVGKTAHYGRSTGLDFFEPCNNVQDIPAVRKRIQGEIDYIKQIIDGFLANEYLFPKEIPDSEAESGQALEEPELAIHMGGDE